MILLVSIHSVVDLATGGRTWHVPWKDLADPSTARRFIEPEYLPDGFTFKAQVSHFTRQQLEEALNFWRHRQTTLGAGHTFRFSQVKAKASGVSGRTADTNYPDDEDTVSGDEESSEMAGEAILAVERMSISPPRTGGETTNKLSRLQVTQEGCHLVGFGENTPGSDVEMDLPPQANVFERSRPRPAPLSIQRKHAETAQARNHHRSKGKSGRSGREASSTQTDRQKTKRTGRRKQVESEEPLAESSDEELSDARPTTSRRQSAKGKGKQREGMASDDEDNGWTVDSSAPKPKPKPRPRPRPSKEIGLDERENVTT